jgi:hypothetical protein
MYTHITTTQKPRRRNHDSRSKPIENGKVIHGGVNRTAPKRVITSMTVEQLKQYMILKRASGCATRQEFNISKLLSEHVSTANPDRAISAQTFQFTASLINDALNNLDRAMLVANAELHTAAIMMAIAKLHQALALQCA